MDRRSNFWNLISMEGVILQIWDLFENKKIIIVDYLIWLFWPPKPSPSLFFLFNHIFSLCIFQLLSQTLILALPIHNTYVFTPRFASWICLTLIFLYRQSPVHLSLDLALSISVLDSLFEVFFIVAWSSLKFHSVVMAESKLDLPEDLIGSRPSDQSWISKGNLLLFWILIHYCLYWFTLIVWMWLYYAATPTLLSRSVFTM